MITVDLIADTTLHSVEEFGDLIVKSQKEAIIRLSDVAKITLGSEDYDSTVVLTAMSNIHRNQSSTRR